MEPDEESVDGKIEDGETINPHGMDPQTVLRFVKSIGAWPGRVLVIACEPGRRRASSASASRSRWRPPSSRAVELVVETVEELRAGVPVPEAG